MTLFGMVPFVADRLGSYLASDWLTDVQDRIIPRRYIHSTTPASSPRTDSLMQPALPQTMRNGRLNPKWLYIYISPGRHFDFDDVPDKIFLLKNSKITK